MTIDLDFFKLGDLLKKNEVECRRGRHKMFKQTQREEIKVRAFAWC